MRLTEGFAQLEPVLPENALVFAREQGETARPPAGDQSPGAVAAGTDVTTDPVRPVALMPHDDQPTG